MKVALLVSIHRKDSRDGDEAFHLDRLDECDCGICARPPSVASGSGAAGELKRDQALFSEV
jgi:hypothetical protein